jgi:two-component system CheB/CheR fusion protein
VLLSVRILAGPKAQGDTVAGEPLLLVSFQHVAGLVKANAKPATRSGRSSAAMVEAARNEELERELAYTRENLQATIEELQATNEELKSTNEELQSTNEELQSTNEELDNRCNQPKVHDCTKCRCWIYQEERSDNQNKKNALSEYCSN